MIHETMPLWSSEEYTYDTKVGFMPTITTYVLEGAAPRNAVLIAPGGAYAYVSPLEGEVVAMKFLEKGFNAFVLTYTCRYEEEFEPVGIQPLKDISRAVSLIRKNSEKWNVNENGIAICGFSAGGHLVTSLGVHWYKDYLQSALIDNHSNKPNAVISAYPVVSADYFAHVGSFINTIGINATEDEKLEFSLEKQVTDKTAPTFLWHTSEDDIVPVENSIMFASALQKNKIPFELHIYTKGHHGMSTADKAWGNFGVDSFNSPTTQYTKKKIRHMLAEKENKSIGEITDEQIYEQMKDDMKNSVWKFADPDNMYAHNSSWVKLCIEWLESTFAN